MKPKEALLIATIAHGAVGQMRWDNGREKVPYIVHPKRVALLTRWFFKKYFLEITRGLQAEKPPYDYFPATFDFLDDLRVAAYLHDVLEDTKVKPSMLLDAGITRRQLDTVLRLTKPDNGPAPQSYYQGISESTAALIVKCADRCSNLEDAYKELFAPVEEREVRRWANYIDKTYTDVLPMYKLFPGMRSEIQWRLDRIQQALPLARRQRETFVNRIRPCRLIHTHVEGPWCQVHKSYACAGWRGVIEEVA